MSWDVIQDKNGKSDKCQWECKELIKHHTCEKDYAWNTSICACNCDKDCENDKDLKNFECDRSLADDLVVTCDETENTPKCIIISSNTEINYWLTAIVLSAAPCLLLVKTINK